MGFQLGLFSPNTESGLAITTAPERWHATWDDNLRLARLADETGIDFLLPVARWTDWGPGTDFHRSALDPLVWATGMLAHTSRLRVFSTVHTAFHHPVVAAKQLATADHVSKGPDRVEHRGGLARSRNTRCSASRCPTTTTRVTRSRRSGGTS
ncbi:LLM class flavin-dependent oxidoreductase [Actinomadura chokoriensis]|uniref:LLM class flavin-dependent oxidoreductase n=1 Tax=Actinomadura chokoriensis TaxID=454156 RepID=A0ABV4QTB0_9ACTN